MPTYIFHAKYKNYDDLWCEVEMLGEHTLDDLHCILFNVFGFPEEKLYSFFMSNEAWDAESEYCSPLVEGDHADDVSLDDLGLKIGDKFLYLFDYGVNHEFEIELLEIGEQEDISEDYPHLLAEEGELPSEFLIDPDDPSKIIEDEVN